MLVFAAAVAAAAVDTHVLGFGPPFVRRQVDENWLAAYRPWVYGGGFGWQIGVGVTTYVMTAAVPLMIVLGALTASWSAGLGLGVAFGLARGLAVLLGAPLRTRSALHAFHRRFTALGEPVRRAVVGVELSVAVVGAAFAFPPAAAILVGIGTIAMVVRARTVPSSVRRPLAA